jgi:GNAT superfamily N-acetyltransferase
MIEYREICPSDFDLLCALGRQMHAESSYSALEFSESRLREIFEEYLSSPNKMVFVAVRDGELLGLYAGYVSKYYFSDELVANDIAWFVVKERRGSRIGLRLLDCFEHWALERGASEVRIGYSTNINPTAFDSLMHKRGYSRVGANYRLENRDV